MKKPTVRELLAKASQAEPQSKSRSSWAELFPVIDTLVTKRGYSPWKAIGWLVENGAIPSEAKSRVCYHSYLGYARRRTKQRAKEAAENQGLPGSGFDEDAAH